MIMPGRSCVAGIAIRVKLLAVFAEVPRKIWLRPVFIVA